jgi:hypothetical protein
MAGDEIDQEAARLTAASAALKIEHARLSATAHTARELEAHVADLRAHVQCLRACIEQMRQRSISARDSAAPPRLQRDNQRIGG